MGSVSGISIESLLAVVAVQALTACAVGVLHRHQSWLRRALPYVISLAVGVLLATGLGHLLPEALEHLGNRTGVWLVLLGAVLGFYAFERIFQALSGQALSGSPMEPAVREEVHAGHHHHHHASRPATLLFGSVTHSLVDGTSIAAAFSIDRRVGWITALAVGLHEMPHRLGDFALLVHMGLRQERAAALSILAGLSSLVGWAVVLALGSYGTAGIAWLLPISAASFLYISLVDLLPELRSERRPGAIAWQLVCLVVGATLAIGLTQLPGA